ncbi:hypothetical protein [Curtobacterium sp. ME12]|uniref:hypothetical protein n=1 Tax=Curtobacterium sp. ME12 TaxID=2744253 RepID=UPI0015F67ACE|nr:hypothetical protein [Curtobacterium sp. ME12]
MDWKNVSQAERDNAVMFRLSADDASSKEHECRTAAAKTTDPDSRAMWLLLAIKHHVAALSHTAAADMSDEIATYAETHQPR